MPDLSDDPLFKAKLSDLDRGLADDASRTVPAQPPVAVPAIGPRPTAGSGMRRPLIELFPPAEELHAPPVRHVPPPATVAPPETVVPPVTEVPPPTQPGAGPSPVEAPSGPSAASPHSSRAGTLAPSIAPAPRADEAFYGLAERPFMLDTDLKFLYQSSAVDRAAQEMLSAIRRRDGIVVLTGPLGIGKTTLCRLVIEELDQHTLTSFVGDPFASAEDLLLTVLLDFGVISRADVMDGRVSNASAVDLAVTLRDFLSSLEPLQAFAVVIVDDAHRLPPALLEQVRTLVDTESGERLLQVVLVGEPSLEALLRRRELRSLNDRISVRCALGRLKREEIRGYILARLRAAGAKPSVEFDDGAVARIADLSGGNPRIVNLVCDRALAVGISSLVRAIDEEMINRAADDLGLAPPTVRGPALRMLMAALALLLLMAIGAAAAVVVFRTQVAAALSHWTGHLAPPPAPPPSVPPPYRPPSR